MSPPRHGWILEWFVKDDDTLVDQADIVDITIDRLQDVFAEPSADSMMCYSYRVGPEHVEVLRLHVGCEIDLRRFDYFVSGWSERGFRTPGGLYPPPRDLPPAFGEARRVRPVTPAQPSEPPTLH
jgi:hypothetical protein